VAPSLGASNSSPSISTKLVLLFSSSSLPFTGNLCYSLYLLSTFNSKCSPNLKHTKSPTTHAPLLNMGYLLLILQATLSHHLLLLKSCFHTSGDFTQINISLIRFNRGAGNVHQCARNVAQCDPTSFLSTVPTCKDAVQRW
jgi:hypothetical protein